MNVIKVKKEILNKILSCERVHDYDYLKPDNCYQIYVWDNKGNFHIKRYALKN